MRLFQCAFDLNQQFLQISLLNHQAHLAVVDVLFLWHASGDLCEQKADVGERSTRVKLVGLGVYHDRDQALDGHRQHHFCVC